MDGIEILLDNLLVGNLDAEFHRQVRNDAGDGQGIQHTVVYQGIGGLKIDLRILLTQ